MTETEELENVLRRSAELHNALDLHLSNAAFDESTRTQMTLSTALISLEHALGVCVLVEAGHLVSANALLRTHLEATVRAAWLLYAASDEWVDRYFECARANPLKDPGASPNMEEMIRAIERRAAEGKAPAGVAPQLLIFKQGAWGPLNSFVHSGIHPITLQMTGYPLDAALGTVRNANGLSVVASMIIAVLTGDERLAKGMSAIQRTFLDCCPPVSNPVGA